MSTDVRPSRARASEVSAPRHTVRRFARRGAYQDTKLLLALSLLPLAIVVGVVISPVNVPFTSLMVPLLLGSLLLTPRLLPYFCVYLFGALMVSLAAQESVTLKTYGAVGIQVLMCLIVLAFALRRQRLGVAGAIGESMFVDLRDRILQQGGIPELAAGWHAESALRSAGGTPFAGDFIVACTTPGRLHLVVVDVSGKGEEAGTRALLLSGAFGGLLGALPPEQFLTAANDYLLRQDWDEGFATAVHLTLDLDDGSFEVRSAGHPPAALRHAGAGRWGVLTSEGPVLGLMPDADFVTAHGRIGHQDALLLYTDGMVEEPRRDIDLGLDRMLGEAEHLLRGGVEGAARRMVDALGSRDDDRAVVVIARR
ncbi:serine/threonine-protein phosphatase [Nocardioides anomalus]|uniref:Serine/threonine-protein phosphatase n=1 Tax=Nocardioides anomalus TaxID=2712223 RepID=A0A6G6WAH8_9ACTN|nr:PP2C family protein-serine/threonine phosphatase [Nocardioides anomalus]QIG42167.1 serine/threonine-protein phosphatase [Nocardioides anomalus]